MGATDIGLLFGVPVTESEFLFRVSESDWLRRYRTKDRENNRRKERLKAVWETQYYPWVATHFLELIDRATQLGIEVQLGAGLSHLHDLTERLSTVIIFSHWKGAEISNDDFLATATELEFVDQVKEEQSTLGKWLLEQFRDLGIDENQSRPIPRFLKRLRSSNHPRNIRSVLREALQKEIPDYRSKSDGIDIVLEHDVTRQSRRREELDQMFQGLLSPGNRLELFDGMHSKEEVEQAIDSEFHGILDLTTCTSSFLADYISGCRQSRLRTVQYENVQDPIWAAKSVSLTLEIIEESQIPYLEARNSAHSLLMQTLNGGLS